MLLNAWFLYEKSNPMKLNIGNKTVKSIEKHNLLKI